MLVYLLYCNSCRRIRGDADIDNEKLWSLIETELINCYGSFLKFDIPIIYKLIFYQLHVIAYVIHFSDAFM